MTLSTLCRVVKLTLIKAVIFTVIFTVLCVIYVYKSEKKLQLKQVLILSRHNVRTPLSENIGTITPQRWPDWKEPPGVLTKKGFLLESYMGIFFSTWLSYKNLINGCPVKEDIFVLANSMERTVSSAKAFVEGGYPNCNITIYNNANGSDSIFSRYIHNSTKAFKEIALQEMTAILNTTNLKTSYLQIENILNYEQSERCKKEKLCNIAEEKNNLDIIVGKKPQVDGPLKISNKVIDTFLMEYYNGLKEEEVAWGKLKSYNDWDEVLRISASYHDVMLNSTHIALDMAMPLLKYLRNLFLNHSQKMILLMGHDTNIHVLINALSIKPYKLENSFVPTPIGGKIVFQKWFDVTKNEYLLKINYVYQTTEQIREGKKLSWEEPPMFKLLELNDCKIDDDGFCHWEDFMTLLNTYQ